MPAGLAQGGDHDIFENEEDCARDEMGRFVSCVVRLFVNFTGRDDLDNVSINLDMCPAFMVPEKCILLPQLRGGNRTPLVLEVRFRVSKTIVPSSLNVDVVASFTTSKGEPRTARTDFRLPVCLAARVVAPVKNAAFMFTLDTNRDPPPLTDLFGDVLNSAIDVNPDIQRTALNVMTLVYYGGNVDITILVSKKAGRYRLQCGDFEAFALLTQELCVRLQQTFAGDGNKSDPFKIAFKEQLPLHDYFSVIDKHHGIRLRMSELQDKLEKRATQFRVIQKRLLARFKDKNPAPLNQLDVLFKDTYQDLLDFGSEMEEAQAALQSSANLLTCATELLQLLIRYAPQPGSLVPSRALPPP